jgi:hypothetical protein
MRGSEQPAPVGCLAPIGASIFEPQSMSGVLPPQQPVCDVLVCDRVAAARVAEKASLTKREPRFRSDAAEFLPNYVELDYPPKSAN